MVTYEARDDKGETRNVRARFQDRRRRRAVGCRQAGRSGADRLRYVFAYHEIIGAAGGEVEDYDPRSCDIYRGFPRRFTPGCSCMALTASVGVGSAHKGFLLKDATSATRAAAGLSNARTLRRGRADP